MYLYVEMAWTTRSENNTLIVIIRISIHMNMKILNELEKWIYVTRLCSSSFCSSPEYRDFEPILLLREDSSTISNSN